LTSHKDSEQDLEEIWDEKLLRELVSVDVHLKSKTIIAYNSDQDKVLTK